MSSLWRSLSLTSITCSRGPAGCAAVCNRLHGVQVHHIVPRHQGGSEDASNAIPLCPNCHDEVHADTHLAGRLAFIRSGELCRAAELHKQWWAILGIEPVASTVSRCRYARFGSGIGRATLAAVVDAPIDFPAFTPLPPRFLGPPQGPA